MRSIFSYHFGKQFKVCFTEAKICTRPFCKQQTVPSDCLRLCIAAWMFEVRRDKCTLIENSEDFFGLL